jgi:hypothetical protein
MQILAVPRDGVSREQAMAEVEQVMRIRHSLHLDEPDDFDMATQDAILKIFDQVTQGAFLALVGAILATSLWRWLNLILGRSAKDLREAPPVWLEDEVVALERASGAFGWLWALVLLFMAVLRHLAGEAPPARAVACDHGNGGVTVADQELEGSAASRGRAWALREEERFRRPRCC